MRAGKLVRSFARKLGTMFEIYDDNGNFVGKEKEFITPIARSVDEDIAAYGRTAIFHYKTLLKPGGMVRNTIDGNRYFINAMRSFSFSNKLALWSVFLIQINCDLSSYRKTFIVPNGEHSSDGQYQFIPIVTNIPAYIQKKDWTVETFNQFGRDERGYEVAIVQIHDIQKSDRIIVRNKAYIVHDIDLNIRLKMMELQLGVDIKYVPAN